MTPLVDLSLLTIKYDTYKPRDFTLLYSTPINVMVSSSLSSQTIFHPLLKWEMVGLINIMFLAEDNQYASPTSYDKGLLKTWLCSDRPNAFEENRTIIAVKHSSSITAPAKDS